MIVLKSNSISLSTIKWRLLLKITLKSHTHQMFQFFASQWSLFMKNGVGEYVQRCHDGVEGGQQALAGCDFGSLFGFDEQRLDALRPNHLSRQHDQLSLVLLGPAQVMVGIWVGVRTIRCQRYYFTNFGIFACIWK